MELLMIVLTCCFIYIFIGIMICLDDSVESDDMLPVTIFWPIFIVVRSVIGLASYFDRLQKKYNDGSGSD